MKAIHTFTVFRKELKDVMRDRRTLIFAERNAETGSSKARRHATTPT